MHFLFAIDRSQRHKHVQFIPLPPPEEFRAFPDNIEGQNDKRIPFQHYIRALSHEDPSQTLFHVYDKLLQDVKKVNSEENLSYNFVMTTEWIFLSPRTKDDYVGQQYDIGVNSTGMVGLLLTKSEAETQFIEEIGPLSILSDVGKPWPQKS